MKSIMLIEARRELRKRSFLALILLALMPLITSLILKYIVGSNPPRDEELWAVVLGLKTTGQIGTLEAAGVAAWAWIVAVLYGGDLLASDLSDGTARFILSRPVSRREYLLAKTVTVSLVIMALFAFSGLLSYIAGHILIGDQKGLLSSIFYGALVGVGILPLLFLAALIGQITRKPSTGMILGFVAYFIAGIIVAIVAALSAVNSGLDPTKDEIAFQAEIIRAEADIALLIPFLAGLKMPSMVYWAMKGDTIMDPYVQALGVKLDAGYYAAVYTISTIAGIVILFAAMAYLLNKADI